MTDSIREQVRQSYANAARATMTRVAETEPQCELASSLYAPSEIEELPAAAAEGSLGCGNPVAVAELRPGEIVLDLGSGGGIDVLLSARRVGPTGFAYGLDMTDEMLALARANASEAGVSNVSFVKGYMEKIPLPDASVDVVIQLRDQPVGGQEGRLRGDRPGAPLRRAGRGDGCGGRRCPDSRAA